jgi:spore maturation protein CgeB
VRIAVLDTCYPAFLDDRYRRSPGLASRPYEEQLHSLLEFSFGTSDAYAVGLRAVGHAAENLITNCVPLQLQWLRENGRARLTSRWASLPGRGGNAARHLMFQRIAAAQIDAYDPQVVFVHDLWSMTRATLRRWRRQGRFLVGQIASPPPAESVFGHYDLLLSSFPHFVERFRSLGLDAEYYRLAFYDIVLDRLRARGVDADARTPGRTGLVFVGGVDPSLHGKGTHVLEQVAHELDLEVWGYGAERLPADSTLRRRHRGEAWGLDMYEVLARSAIVLNRHIDVAEGYANNMRLYEATGAGALLLTDEGKGLGDMFDGGTEVVTFSDAADLIEKARHFLAAEDERARIAAAGQDRTLADHTYALRMAELSSMLNARISSSHPVYASAIRSAE